MNNEQIAMLSIPKETVKGTAPALASNMSLAFDKASLTGNVNFTAPTTTYAGGKLTGSLKYVVSVDGKEATKHSQRWREGKCIGNNKAWHPFYFCHLL